MSSGAFHAAWREAFPPVDRVVEEVYPRAEVEAEAGFRPRPRPGVVAPQVPQLPKEKR